MGACAANFLVKPAATPSAFVQAVVGHHGISVPKSGFAPAAGQAAAQTPPGNFSSLKAVATLAAGLLASRVCSRRKYSFMSRQALRWVPVLDINGKLISEEDCDFKTFSTTTANYAVHQEVRWFRNSKRRFTAFVPRPSDLPHGTKPWKQKGTGRARASTLWGRKFKPWIGNDWTPHGKDSAHYIKTERIRHHGAISTVLQSKWRGIRVIDGLEGWKEYSVHKLEDALEKWTRVGYTPYKGMRRRTLVITRSGWGKESTHYGLPHKTSLAKPLYMSGRLIRRCLFRGPQDLDIAGDGLIQLLRARRVVISREAFHDLKAKFWTKTGWAWKTSHAIMTENLQDIAARIPCDMKAEIEAARKLGETADERRQWARTQRLKEGYDC